MRGKKCWKCKYWTKYYNSNQYFCKRGYCRNQNLRGVCMNNRYLYKAKKIYKEEWVEGFYVLCRGHHYILPVYDLDHGFDERYSEWVEIEPSTLCQCTGLMDKNDKLIWENEKCLITKPCTCVGVHIVFKDGCFWGYDKLFDSLIKLCDLKVNSYEIEVVSKEPKKLFENQHLVAVCGTQGQVRFLGSLRTVTMVESKRVPGRLRPPPT